MRTRDIRVGLAVEHAKSGKPLGRVVSFNDTLVTLDGECPIATPAELRPMRTTSDGARQHSHSSAG